MSPANKGELLRLRRRGKVRDMYDLDPALQERIPGVDGDVLLMMATDRISAFDVVLPTPIPDKGKVLTQMSAFWFDKTRHLVENHVIATLGGQWLDSAGAELRDELAPYSGRGMLVRLAQRIDIECIVRGYLAGSAWAEYRRAGTIWGQPMPAGMVEGQELPQPMFTPTTKAEEGHDENMTHQDVVDMAGPDLARRLEEHSLVVYSFAKDYARQRGIILVDTKMEFGLLDGRLILIDELLTPDSSRFWDAEGYEPGSSLPNFDKQYVRDWLDAQGWDREPPAPDLPEDVVARTSQRYEEAYRRLTGQDLPTS